MTETSQRRRIIVVVAILAFIGIGLATRLCFLHLGDNERLLAKIQDIREVEQELVVSRGRVLDRNGNIMALDMSMRNVAVDPKFMREHGHPRFTGMQLSRLLALDPAMVLAHISRDQQYVELAKQVPEETVRQIEAMRLPGVRCPEISKRHYPRGSLMSHVVGFANAEAVGSAGIEQKMERYLRGVPGLRVTEVDGRRHEVYLRRAMEIEPQPGADVQLTLDQNLQYFVEKALDDALATNGAKGAWAIVQHVRTGEILAMASRPDYDLNNFNAVDADNRLNRAIGYTFEPGSVFKVIVYAAAFNEGILTPSEIFDCENGLWHYAGKPLRDYHPYGRLTTTEALKKSSNIAAAKIAIRLGEDRLYRYLKLFGIGTPTGINLPGEEGGILNPLKKWTKLSVTRIPMGHEVAVTSMQMLQAVNAIANGGEMMRPLVLKRVTNSKGEALSVPQPEAVGHPIRPETARLMARLLTEVTEDGTGKKARVAGHSVAGKTGTAEKPGPGGYDAKRNLASFVGFLPAENPEVSIMVTFDEPHGDFRTGGAIAAPVFQAIAEQTVRYLDVPPVPETQRFTFASGSDAVKE
jgi:cell division protein FtsI/penicillin-binding protein 2